MSPSFSFLFFFFVLLQSTLSVFSACFSIALLHLLSSSSFLNFFVSVSLFNYFSLFHSPFFPPLFSFNSRDPSSLFIPFPPLPNLFFPPGPTLNSLDLHPCSISNNGANVFYPVHDSAHVFDDAFDMLSVSAIYKIEKLASMAINFRKKFFRKQFGCWANAGFLRANVSQMQIELYLIDSIDSKKMLHRR